MTQSNRSSVTVCVAVGCTVGLLVFLAVAPFECEDNGICHGFLAFDYGRDSRGPWQAVGAGALVGAVAAILLFAVLAQGRAKSVMRLLLTPFLLAGIAITVLSQSILFVLGPLICGLVLWGLWKGNASASANAEPPPFYDRAN
jgi:hypothetical protein